MEGEKLTFWGKIGFGIGDIGGNALFTIMAFWLMNYLTDTVGLAAGLAGIALWGAKIWDAITDPIMGYISDKTQTRWGRRRPYLFLGGVIALFSMVVMFYNPHFDVVNQQMQIFIWAVMAYCFLCTAFTIFNIPYSALTPDLTDDFHERTSLNGVRMFFAVIGTFLAAGAFLPIVGLFTPEGSVDKSQGYFAAGIIYGIVIMVVTFVTFFSVREKKVEKSSLAFSSKIFKSYLRALRNRPFLLILFPYALNLIGTTIISQNLQYYFKYIFAAENLTAYSLLALLGCTMLFIPLWTPLIKRIGKNIAYAIGLFIIAFACLMVFSLAHKFGVVFMIVMMGIAGIGLAAAYIAPWTMIPDTVEYDQRKSGVREEGIYYGLWTFFSKTGQAIAALIGGFILQVTAYVANAAVQGNEALLGIRFLLGPVPASFLIASGVIVLFYPINEQRYREILAEK